MTDAAARWAAAVTDYPRVIIAVLLVATAVIGAGAVLVEEETDLSQFESESEAVEASEFIGDAFVAEGAENQTTVQVIRRGADGEDVLTREEMLDSLALQQELADHPDIGPMLAEEEPMTGVANVVALYHIRELLDGFEAADPVDPGSFDNLSADQREALADLLDVSALPPDACLDALAERETDQPRQLQQPPLSCQKWAIEEMSDEEFEAAIEAVLGPDGQPDALALVPQSYEAGSTTAEAHNLFINQQTDGGAIEDPDGFSDRVVDGQLAVRDLADRQNGTHLTFGLGLLDSEIEQSLDDSIVLVAPLALLFVVLVLTVVYRDLLDILLGVFGILAVLLWTFGFMGWAGIAFNQLMVSVPVLLIGLSIDFALHAFMRHRERRAEGRGVRDGMRVALAGVIVALAWVTATAAIGFLSNLVSPIRPLQEFGVTSAVGIVSALLVFGMLVPALKVELDTWLERRGYDRSRRAFGTDDSRVSRLLSVGAIAARRAPVAVLVIALVVSGIGAYGGTQVDTSFDERDFLAEDPPPWTQQLPGPLAADEYQVTGDLDFLRANFQQVGREGELLIRGNVTSDDALAWLDSAAENASQQQSTFVLPNGDPDVRSPLRELRLTAELSPESAFAESYREAGGNGVPTENVSGLYDGMTAINPAASEVVHGENGEYDAIRMQVGIDGNASQERAAEDLERIAAHLEETSGGELEVVATGDLIVNGEIEQNLFETVVESLLLTLVVVFLFLAVGYRLLGHPASLGVVTLVPVLFAVTWILGTMWLAGMSFNALTGTIAALTIGLGIDYTIHISDRYQQELRRQGDVRAALHTTVTGTGGALLGTAATTVGGFGMLAVAILPALQQFGFVIALTIVYAFLASVLVLPSLLVLWTRYLGPGEPADSRDGKAPASEPATAPDD